MYLTLPSTQRLLRGHLLWAHLLSRHWGHNNEADIIPVLEELLVSWGKTNVQRGTTIKCEDWWPKRSDRNGYSQHVLVFELNSLHSLSCWIFTIALYSRGIIILVLHLRS